MTLLRYLICHAPLDCGSLPVFSSDDPHAVLNILTQLQSASPARYSLHEAVEPGLFQWLSKEDLEKKTSPASSFLSPLGFGPHFLKPIP